MINLSVTFNQDDLNRWLTALNNVVSEAYKQFVNDGGEMNKRCAVQMSNMLFQNISRFSSYPDYNPRYALWKERMGLMGQGFWKLKGDLMKAISYFQEEGGWMAGVPYTAMDTGGKSWFGVGNKGIAKPIAMYGTVMEVGGNYGLAGYHPARPLFEPTQDIFKESVWLTEAELAMQAIERMWR